MRPWFSIALLALAAATGCRRSDGPEVGGDTHWLAACEGDAHCDRGTCICGLCTEACEGDAQCQGGRAAACYESDSPGVRQHCGAARSTVTEAEGICLATCQDELDCSAGERCVGGACVHGAEHAAPPDGGTVDPQAPPLPTTRASEFSELEPDVSFDEPAAVPEPATAFELPDGAVPLLVGTWRLNDCSESIYDACPWLEIAAQQETGEVTGRFHWEPGQGEVVTELPPVLDANVGYPPNVAPREYDAMLGEPTPGGYRMLDARLADGTLSFWMAPTELWSDWCAQQTSYANPGGEPAYICVRPDEVSPDSPVDLGKRALCTSELTQGICGSEDGPVACSCYTDGEPTHSALCSIAFCHCDARGCRANLHAQRSWVELQLDGEKLVMTRWYDTVPSIVKQPMTFHRQVSP